MKKLFITVLIIGLGIFISMGCVTKNLWKETDVKPYYDTIISFYANPKENKIIFIGTKYHYIFDEGTTPLEEVLKAKDFLALNKSNLQIYTYTPPQKDTSIIHTELGIHFEEHLLNAQQKNWLSNHNFQLQKQYVPMRIKSFELKGKRYKANSQVNAKALKLKEPISIQVNVHTSDTLYKVLMTPLTVTADAGLALAGAIIFPIVWITK